MSFAFGVAGFAPAASGTQSRRTIQAAQHSSTDFLSLARRSRNWHCYRVPSSGPTQAVIPTDLRVIDGDTLSWRGERVRLVGFDTPEIFSPRCASEVHKGQAAKRMLAGLIARARSADLAIHPERDRYGRMLATLSLDGTDVGRSLVAAGLARPYLSGRRQGWCGV